VAAEPAVKRTIVFVDGQNLFYGAKIAFGYPFPNYDILSLATTLCQQHGWQLGEVRFYTGIPDATDNAFWNHFWTAKLAQMGRDKINVFSRPLRYRNQTARLPDGKTHTFLVGAEKGVDVRLAIDIIRLAHSEAFDVALVLSQDQDLSEVADEIRVIGQEQNRWIKIASAFPASPASKNVKGIYRTDWIKIDRATYDGCIDSRDYRPKKPKP
jgi:uncharacterized LabA/DUF88 family protein